MIILLQWITIKTIKLLPSNYRNISFNNRLCIYMCILHTIIISGFEELEFLNENMNKMISFYELNLADLNGKGNGDLSYWKSLKN